MLTLAEINNSIPFHSRLKVIETLPRRQRPSGNFAYLCKCICVCGTTDHVCETAQVIRGNTLSCGCYERDMYKMRRIKRKYSKHIPRLYMQYVAMIRRCYNEFSKGYKYYGGRGVIVCKEWVESYQLFLDWSLANGWEQGLQLDKDIKGSGLLYSPTTCCWVTRKRNMEAKKNRLKYKYNGEMMFLTDIAQILKTPYITLYVRIRYHIKKHQNFDIENFLTEITKK